MKPNYILSLFLIIICSCEMVSSQSLNWEKTPETNYTGTSIGNSFKEYEKETKINNKYAESTYFSRGEIEAIDALASVAPILAESLEAETVSLRATNNVCLNCDGTGLDPDRLSGENTPCPVCKAGTSNNSPISDHNILPIFFLLGLFYAGITVFLRRKHKIPSRLNLAPYTQPEKFQHS